MSALAIRVENLSKQFYIGRVRNNHETFRDALANALTSPYNIKMLIGEIRFRIVHDFEINQR